MSNMSQEEFDRRKKEGSIEVVEEAQPTELNKVWQQASRVGMAGPSYEEFMAGMVKNVPSSDKKGGNKFGAKRTEIDGHKFASKLEGNRYITLRDAQANGVIKNLKLQPRIWFFEKFQSADGKKWTGLRYTADFQYEMADTGQRVIEEVKSKATVGRSDFRMRLQMLAYFEEEFYMDLVIVQSAGAPVSPSGKRGV